MNHGSPVIQQIEDAHTLTPQDALLRLGVDPRVGLSDPEARARRDALGPNELPQEKPVSWLRLLARQFRSTLLWVLLGAIVLSVFLGEWVEAVAIAVIVLFSVILGLWQEVRATRAVESLRRLAAPKANVVRSGTPKTIDARDVVPGDLVVFGAGDKIPADARILEAYELSVVEASLTGESVPTEKDAGRVLPSNTAIGDRTNMVFGTTLVARGRGRAIVTATGAATEVGRIGALVARLAPEPTPLERQLATIARFVIRLALTIVALVVVVGVLRGHPWNEMFLFGVALAVAVVPEALPAVVTISLALGAQRIARRHAIVRRLPVVETLGSTTVICSDKTGTLTMGDMLATVVLMGGKRFLLTGHGYRETGEVAPRPDGELARVSAEIARAALLCNDAELVHTADLTTVVGDPTEGALLALSRKLGADPALRSQHPRLREIGFSSERKRMTTVHAFSGQDVVYSKGAAEEIVARCDRQWTADGVVALTDERRARLRADAEQLAAEGLRTLAFSFRPHADEPLEERHVFLGIVGMRDPPRRDVAAAIQTCYAAGIRPVMITGDHPATAQSIAQELGIRSAGTLTGPHLESMTPNDLQQQAKDVGVFARVSPTHKLAIVQALQSNNEIVAMTGDGVNDAPALRRADIGIAMGITGTDVAKESAAMVLSDDNFSTIVASVEEGRVVFDNVRKYLVYLMSTNLGEALLIAGSLLIGLPLPLSAVQILYVNLASDGLPALALAVDPREEDVMRRPPRRPGRPMLDRPTLLLMTIGGVFSAVANLAVFWWALSSGRGLAMAMSLTFVTLVLIQFTKAYVFRSERRSILRAPFANRWLNIAVAWELVLLFLIVTLSPLRLLFGVEPFAWQDWLVAAMVALSVVPVMESAKWVLRRGRALKAPG